MIHTHSKKKRHEREKGQFFKRYQLLKGLKNVVGEGEVKSDGLYVERDERLGSRAG